VAAQGYFLAAFLFLGIVFALPVALGTAALALDLPLSTDEALGGLVFPATAYVLVGKAGAPPLPHLSSLKAPAPPGASAFSCLLM
jgi:hypothetical protein